MKETRDTLFGGVLLIMLLSLIGFGFLALLHKIDLTPAAVIITFLATNCVTLIGFRWGSSKGSKDKDAIIQQKGNEEPAALAPVVIPPAPIAMAPIVPVIDEPKTEEEGK